MEDNDLDLLAADEESGRYHVDKAQERAEVGVSTTLWPQVAYVSECAPNSDGTAACCLHCP